MYVHVTRANTTKAGGKRPSKPIQNKKHGGKKEVSVNAGREGFRKKGKKKRRKVKAQLV